MMTTFGIDRISRRNWAGGLGMAAAVFINIALPASPSPISPVRQEWAIQLKGPSGRYFEAGALALGPSGDTYLAGYSPMGAPTGDDIVVSRHNPAGGIVWQRRFEGGPRTNSPEYATAMVARGTNIYILGRTGGYDGSADIVTLKYSESGNLEWSARFDGAGHLQERSVAIDVDTGGNVIVAGDSIGVDGSYDFVVVKYGPAGNRLWTYTYAGPGSRWETLTGMRLDSAGNIHVAGTSADSSTGNEVITLKLDPAGNVHWTARETSAYSYGVEARGLDVNSAGEVVVIGSERDYAVTWKYDSAGHRQWTARYRAEEPASMVAARVRFDGSGSGNVIVATKLYGSGTNDTVVLKYAPDGRQLWASRVGFPQGPTHLQALAVDLDGNAYVTAAPTYDAVTTKISADGNQVWSIFFDSVGSYADDSRFLEVDSTGNVFMAGRSVYFSDGFTSFVKYRQETVAGQPSATVTPAVQVVDPGDGVVFTAAASGLGPLQYQWRQNGRIIPDATGSTLTLPSAEVVHRGDYSVVVTGQAGMTISPEARLSVRQAPVVTITPTNVISYVGMNEGFIATVAGNDFATLQWRHDGVAIPGATNESLRLENLSRTSGGLYDVVVSTVGGTTISEPARLQMSSAVNLVGKTTFRTYGSGWETRPLLHVLPGGESVIAATSNHLAHGLTISVRKYNAGGALQWSTAFESPEFTNAQPLAMELDANGNIYVAGLSVESYQASASGVLKYSPDGQFRWFRRTTATNQSPFYVTDFAVDSAGNSVLGTLGNYGPMLVRRSGDGDVEWTDTFVTADIGTLSVAVGGSGHSYVGVTSRSNSMFYLRQINSAGATVWERSYMPGLYNRMARVGVDSSGNLIAVGTAYSNDEDVSSIVVLKYSSAGNLLWATRTGGPEVSEIRSLIIGANDDITILTSSDDDFTPEQSGVTRLGADGQVRYRVFEPAIIVWNYGTLAVDRLGNAYVTGYGYREGSGVVSVTARYGPDGRRDWLVHYNALEMNWEYGTAIGVDAQGEVRTLVWSGFFPNLSFDVTLLHYKQRDPAGSLRIELVRDAGTTFHLTAPTGEVFGIEASSELQTWTRLSEQTAQRLLQPGANSFTEMPWRFFRLYFPE